MKRQGTLEQISDGKLYNLNDMVKADCGSCQGCSSCCSGMGTSVILDPMDIFRITTNLNVKFEDLLSFALELNVVEGIILPNLRMTGDGESCGFLKDARCSIHPFRPGVCRLFPLGRYYSADSFQYFLQIHECPRAGGAKVKVRKWIDTPKLKEYEPYITSWHYFLSDMRDFIKRSEDREKAEKTVNMFLLKTFYLRPYDGREDFYGQFYERFNEAGEHKFDNIQQ